MNGLFVAHAMAPDCVHITIGEADWFCHQDGVIYLDPRTAGATDPVALACAAHEAAHALQCSHKHLSYRCWLLARSNIPPLAILACFILSLFTTYPSWSWLLAFAAWSVWRFAVLLWIEREASAMALSWLVVHSTLTDDEIETAKHALRELRETYWRMLK